MLLNWIVLIALGLAISFHVEATPCELPPEWYGEWFQSDRAHLGPVVITRHTFTAATCVQRGKSNRYLFREDSYDDQGSVCHKCMVINMKHRNVIQYKESYCDPLTSELDALCHGITGDAMLFSMFLMSAQPRKCPFLGPLTFTYSRNLRECTQPVSQVDSCADDSRLLLRFQACADVPGSESFEEELMCLGEWQEGVNHYLVAKVNHSHAKSDNDRYRCFIYERTPHPSRPGATVIHLAQSADATCQGLVSAYDGAKTLKLTRAPGSRKCRLPAWLTAHAHWHTLDRRQSYTLYHRNTSVRVSNGAHAPTSLETRAHSDLRLVCHEYRPDDRPSTRKGRHRPAPARPAPPNTIAPTPVKPETRLEHHRTAGDSVTIIVHVTVGCRTGYRCLRLQRRADGVAEVTAGETAYGANEACDSHYYNPGTAVHSTLVARGAGRAPCGPLARYLVGRGDCDEGAGQLEAGCGEQDDVQLRSSCPEDDGAAFYCHGRWSSEGTGYVVASAPSGLAHSSPPRVCLTYSEAHAALVPAPTLLALSVRLTACTGAVKSVLNASLSGPCSEASSSTNCNAAPDATCAAERPLVSALLPLVSTLLALPLLLFGSHCGGS